MIHVQSKRGRPRDEGTHKAILSATYDLLLENGFDAVTVDKIAERAKVSKATIYKWWSNKVAVIMDSFLSTATDRLPVPDTGSTVQDILTHATNLARFLTSREGTVIKELIGAGGWMQNWRKNIALDFSSPAASKRKAFWKGNSKGELRENLDIDVSIDLIYGPIFYRLLITGDEVNDSYVHDLVISAFKGVQPA